MSKKPFSSTYPTTHNVFFSPVASDENFNVHKIPGEQKFQQVAKKINFF